MKKISIISIVFLVSIFALNAQEKTKKLFVAEFSKAELLKIKNLVELYKAIDSTADYSKYTFRSFEMSLTQKGIEITETAYGLLLSEKQKKLISQAAVSTKIFLENIKAIEPGKPDVTVLPAIILKIND